MSLFLFVQCRAPDPRPRALEERTSKYLYRYQEELRTVEKKYCYCSSLSGNIHVQLYSTLVVSASPNNTGRRALNLYYYSTVFLIPYSTSLAACMLLLYLFRALLVVVGPTY